jgi:putative ABC transport system substrate-binding protein
MDRRAFITILAASSLAVPRITVAQTRIARVGIIADPPYNPNRRLDAFLESLREMGYVEGANISFEIRRWDGTSGRTPPIVAELIAIPVDVLVVSTTGSTLAAKRRTTTIPIVVAGAGAVLEEGLVASLARPGGNITGLTSVQPDLTAKRLDILKQAIPTLSRIAVFVSPYREIPSVGERYLKETEVAAQRLGLRVRVVHVETPAEIDSRFRIARQGGAEAGIILPNQFWGANAKQVGEVCLRRRLPVMSQDPGIVEAGGLLQYGVDLTDLWRRAARYVDQILKGAKPGDLPVEQPTKFELIVNLKTAKTLGLTIPPTVLERADEVIE